MGDAMNRLNLDNRRLIIHLLIEGMSIEATSRVTGASTNTIVKLLEDVGAECSTYMFLHMVKLPCVRIQADEIWAFIKMKEKRVPDGLKGLLGYGDTYTWVALCPDTKLVPCFLVGRRDAEHANQFMDDLAWRLPHRIQLSTDAYAAYPEAVERAFGGRAEFGMVKKSYGGERTYRDGTKKRCRPTECSGTTKVVVCGNPDLDRISTSHVERQNLSMRMAMRRYTRKTNGFSKKHWNHHAATALYFMYYNFARIHQTIRVTPAMEAGLAKSPWSVEDIVRLAA